MATCLGCGSKFSTSSETGTSWPLRCFPSQRLRDLLWPKLLQTGAHFTDVTKGGCVARLTEMQMGRQETGKEGAQWSLRCKKL